MPANNCSSAHRPGTLSRTGHPSPLPSAFLLALSWALLALAIASCASSQASDSIAIVQAAYDRLSEGDVDGFMGYFSDDAVVMSGGLPVGREAARQEYLKVVAAIGLRYELSDLASDGKLVTSTCDAFSRDRLNARYSDWVNVVVDGKIIFEGVASELRAECERDPSQAFCP